MSDDRAHEEYDLIAAMNFLGIGRKRLIKWSKEGRLPHHRDGFEWTFTRGDLLDFAKQNCLHCGKPYGIIEEGTHFCTQCAAAFVPEPILQEFQLLDRLVNQRIQLFMMRLAEDSDVSDDREAIRRIQEQFQTSILRACQLWFSFRYQKEGTVYMGLGD